MFIFRELRKVLREFFEQRIVFITLIKRDFSSRYLASYVGLPWAFIQPAMYVFVIWFAFSVGLRGGVGDDGPPQAPWLMLGLIPWMFISQTMIISSNSLTEYSFLIKKTNVPVIMIPVIKVFSGMIVHVILVSMIVILMITFYDLSPTIYWVQIIFYLIALTFLLIGIAWFVSSVNVFVKDMAHIVNILATMLFWATPIIWKYSLLQGSYRYLALLNPFFYITEGYRYTFLSKTWFFEYSEMNAFFWTFAIGIFIIGYSVFRKLQPHFADVL